MKQSMKEIKKNEIFLYDCKGEIIPVVEKADQIYELVVAQDQIKDLLVYKDLFAKK
jgi:hypothetical protein